MSNTRSATRSRYEGRIAKAIRVLRELQVEALGAGDDGAYEDLQHIVIYLGALLEQSVSARRRRPSTEWSARSR